MGNKNDGTRTVKAVEKSLDILEAVRAENGATISEISKSVDLSMGTIHTHLATFKQRGYIVQEGRKYRLSPLFITYGEHVLNSTPLYTAGREEIELLAEKSGECAHLIVENNGLETILYEAFGENAVGRSFYLENRGSLHRHLHYSAAGKAILADMSEERVDQIVDQHKLPARTAQTITNREELRRELQEIDERGYAVNDGERVSGLRAIGTPIQDPTGTVVGAVSLSAPTTRLADENFASEVPELVSETSNIIEVNLQTSDRER